MPTSVPTPSCAEPDDLWLVLPHLGPGGAQKVALLAAQHFAQQGWRLRLVTLLPGHPPAHALPPDLELLDLGPAVEQAWRGDHWNRSWPARSRRFLRAQLRRLHRLTARVLLRLAWPWVAGAVRPGRCNAAMVLLRWCVHGVSGPQAALLQEHLDRCRPRRVLALLSRTNMLSCLALWAEPTHLVVSERNDPARQSLPAPWPRLQALLYQRADVVTANTEGVLGSLASMPGLRRLELLPNPLPAGVQAGLTDPVLGQPRFISVGRLVAQKGLDVLLEARARCTGPAAAWSVDLVGDGPERSALERQAHTAGLAPLVHFAGFRPDPQRYLAAAQVFVLPSRFEGMPNALLEAMAAGLAVIVSDASPGPLEVVEHRRTGLVVPVEDADALAAAMDELAADAGLRHRLGTAAQARIAALDWPAIEPIWRSVLALP
jgi:glycosyltransferase involved in cell wall biosynthesis